MPHKVQEVIRAAGPVDWWIHIIATSGKYSDRLIDIENHWSVRQIVAAHRVLDVWTEIERPPKSPEGFDT
ncbi:MAG: hypothetical protein ACNA8W_02335 [Bradymonadaceae bacterium]